MDEKITVGFLVLFLASSAALLVWFRALAAAQNPLAMMLVLMFTIGGFGTIFSTIISSPDSAINPEDTEP